MTTSDAFSCTCGTGLKRKCPVKWHGKKEQELWTDFKGLLRDRRIPLSADRYLKIASIGDPFWVKALNLFVSEENYEKRVFLIYCECKKRGWL